MIKLLCLLSSFLLVAFGQPAWSPICASLAAIGGYAIFWKGCLSSPHRFWWALCWYMGVHAIHLSWMTSIEFQGFYIIGVYVTLLFFLGLQFGFLTQYIFRTKTHNLLSIFACASLWILLEWSRLFIFCGYSWNPSGMALAASQYSLQLASLLGIFGLSFWVIATNLSVLEWLEKRCKTSLFRALALALIPYLYGAIQISFLDDSKTHHYRSIALVQTDLLPSEKYPLKEYPLAFISPMAQWEQLLTALKIGIGEEKIDFIVFPEAVVPFSATQEKFAFNQIKNLMTYVFGQEIVTFFPHHKTGWVSNLFLAQTLSNYYEAEVIIGLDDRDEQTNCNYQSGFHLTPKGASPNKYEKKILLPLAEYIPFDWLKRWTEKYGIHEFYSPGKGGKVFKETIPISLSICYEETFAHYMRNSRALGAQLFINLTNDNWYPHSQLSKQHFDHARLRSVENGIPLVRSCNAGLSGGFDCFGRSVNKKNNYINERCQIVVAEVPLGSHRTLYTLLGDSGAVSLALILIVLRWLKTMNRTC